MKQDLKRIFKDQNELLDYASVIWADPEIVAAAEAANDRFEMLLRNACNVRHEVRTGIRQSNEEITVTIYEWIERFLARTKRLEYIEQVQLGEESGRIELELFQKKIRFIPDDTEESV